jgi:hypothetical protein
MAYQYRFECHPHTVEVTGSNPVRPTKNKNKGLATMVANPLIHLMSKIRVVTGW